MNSITEYGLMAVLAVTFPAGAQASQQPTGAKDDKTWTGELTAVSAQDKTLAGGHWYFHETFHLGKTCPISTIDKKEAAVGDLRPGERVKIYYQDVDGVLVADRIAEKPFHYRGRIHTIDQKERTVTMHEAPLYQPFRAPRTFYVAPDCRVMLSNGKTGTLAALQPGDRISVLYEDYGGKWVASRIGDQSQAFTGQLDALDLSARTAKAKEMSTEKDFDVARNCQVFVKGERTGQLKDLALGHDYRFIYQKVNGVNVLYRITPVQETNPAETASTS